jgi:hypothetical protein
MDGDHVARLYRRPGQGDVLVDLVVRHAPAGVLDHLERAQGGMGRDDQVRAEAAQIVERKQPAGLGLHRIPVFQLNTALVPLREKKAPGRDIEHVERIGPPGVRLHERLHGGTEQLHAHFRRAGHGVSVPATALRAAPPAVIAEHVVGEGEVDELTLEPGRHFHRRLDGVSERCVHG